MGLVISVNEFLSGGLPPVCAITGDPTDIYVEYPVGKTQWQSRLVRVAPGGQMLVRAGLGVPLQIPMSPGRAAAFRRSSIISIVGALLVLLVGVGATAMMGWPGLLILLGLLAGTLLGTVAAGSGTNIGAVVRGQMVHLQAVHPLLTEAWAGMGTVASPVREPPQLRVAKLDVGPPDPPAYFTWAG